MTMDNLEHLSLHIFEGTFTVANDAETLVGAVLGLYSLILKQKNDSRVRSVYKHIIEEKERYFPRTITYDNDPTTETELFGPLVEMMEDHVESTHQGSETQSSPHIRNHAQPQSGIAPHTHGRAAVFQNELKVGVELDAEPEGSGNQSVVHQKMQL